MSNTESFFVAGGHPDLRCHGACELPPFQDWLTYKAQVYFVKADHNSMGFLEPCANTTCLFGQHRELGSLGGFGWINFLWILWLVNIGQYPHVSSCFIMLHHACWCCRNFISPLVEKKNIHIDAPNSNLCCFGENLKLCVTSILSYNSHEHAWTSTYIYIIISDHIIPLHPKFMSQAFLL